MWQKSKNKSKIKKPRLNFEADGSVTVETAYLLPVLLSVFFLTLYAVFYYHDKLILNGAAGETATVMAAYARGKGESGVDFEGFYESRVAGKLILLRLDYVSAEIGKDEVKASAKASYGKMRVFAEQRMHITRPEGKIRAKRRLTDP